MPACVQRAAQGGDLHIQWDGAAVELLDVFGFVEDLVREGLFHRVALHTMGSSESVPESLPEQSTRRIQRHGECQNATQLLTRTLSLTCEDDPVLLVATPALKQLAARAVLPNRVNTGTLGLPFIQTQPSSYSGKDNISYSSYFPLANPPSHKQWLAVCQETPSKHVILTLNLHRILDPAVACSMPGDAITTHGPTSSKSCTSQSCALMPCIIGVKAVRLYHASSRSTIIAVRRVRVSLTLSDPTLKQVPLFDRPCPDTPASHGG